MIADLSNGGVLIKCSTRAILGMGDAQAYN
jgi:hypothetical protein